jgi:hypothetical protein
LDDSRLCLSRPGHVVFIESSSPRARRFKEIEKLPTNERRHLLGIIDAVLDRHRLAQREAS